MTGAVPREPIAVLVEAPPANGRPRLERLLAWPLEDRPGLARVASIPFLARGLSLGDVIEARDGRLVRVAEKSGHATYRIRFTDFIAPDAFAEWWRPLAALGCACESTSSGLFAVDVPPTADRAAALALLSRGTDSGDLALDPADP